MKPEEAAIKVSEKFRKLSESTPSIEASAIYGTLCDAFFWFAMELKKTEDETDS